MNRKIGKSAIKHSSIEMLSRLSESLNHKTSGSNSLEEPLHLVCKALECDAAALYVRRYLGTDNFILERIGKWHTSRLSSAFCPKSFKQIDLPDNLWNQINSDNFLYADTFGFKSNKVTSSLFVLPLSFEKQPFGFIGLLGVDKNHFEQLDPHFPQAIRNIFELWVCKMNMKKRFEDVVDFIPNPTFIMTKDEKIISWNKANEEMTGWKAEQLIGKDNYESSLPYYFERRPMVANLIMKNDEEWEKKYYEFIRDGDSVSSLAFCPALPNGGAYLRTNTHRLYDENHRLWGAIHTVRDVTIERKMKENLLRSESMYRAISDFAEVGIILFQDNEIVYYNERVLEFMNLVWKNISLVDFINWIHPDDRNRVEKIFLLLRRNKKGSQRFEFRAPNKDDLKYYNASAQTITYEDQKAIHLIIDDVTEQKENNRKERLREIRLYHEGRLASLGILATGIAHELNQPLNTIRIVADGFLYGKDESWELTQDDILDGLKMISKQVVRMSDVIKNVRNFAREDDKLDLVEVDVNNAVENVFSMIGRQLEVHDIKVMIHLVQNLPPVKAHLNRLEQVVMNMVVNSRQALDQCHHDAKCLWVKTGTSGRAVFVEVGDNGTGIPEALQGKIFDPFFTTKEVGQGTGLGLSISRSIVNAFKGQINAFNNDEGGATFVVTLPIEGERA